MDSDSTSDAVESVPEGTNIEELGVSDQVLLSGIPQAVFMIDVEGKVRAWNHGMEELTGIPADRALDRADIGMMLYDIPEDTMIEQVLAAPKRADEVYGLRLEDRSRHLYVKEDRVSDHSGDVARYARITVMPLYEDDELVGAIEMAQDLTEERQRQEATEALVDEVSTTLQALTAGHLDARASFTDSDTIDSHLLGVVDEVNKMADNLQDVVVRVDQQAAVLDESVKRAVAASSNIASNVDNQNDLLIESVNDMQSFSASMEEVAATAEQVDTAAETARKAANEGLDASEDARTATEEVTDLGEELVESVTDLGERMDDIENVVEVISDVAEQTNLLALNANIEAARAGKEGEGFTVVANEVKSLANETRQHTEQITTNINELQAQTDSTVGAAKQSHHQIEAASDQISDVLAALGDIATAIDQSADGIAGVSQATEDQAATVEELTATLEEAREHASETEGAADNIVAATDDQTEAIAELKARVRRLRDDQSDTEGGTEAV
ncbi:methyl-accepting chemotaxis protein [Halalkalicoccus jeotgali]|uniref:Transducer protein htr15 n=1 Tax=Halalkalicoccus jeotgali (strain DSM 18796 / CECT 7217 / JCM 14584 / KCTC 4019 / B3) TaxID=795797 RepID=D8JBD5_HALJB|nr:methyl-accepting chemotaxis protein [Halalkalicoccus jeotgali]ADJ16588.1 transducer protein htr15 [Halalkalicoccus jeotgali B3]ELY41315.1 transducer protein htr15 [Halalkalicoccus jeotgali B3]